MRSKRRSRDALTSRAPDVVTVRRSDGLENATNGVPVQVQTRIYRAGTIKRQRRTKERLGQLDRQIMDVLAEDAPQSVRHVFYRMINPRFPEPVEKSDQGYRHVQHRLLQLRRSGAVPYRAITDATRRGFHVSTFDGAGDFMRRMSGLYRADMWQQTG